MDSQTDFYITLPSNVKSPKDEVNTIANYTTKLPQRIILEGEWEVGLAEISYTLSWYNINKNIKIMLCTFIKGLIKFFRNYELQAGRYEDIGVLIVEIKKIIIKYQIDTDKSKLVTLPDLKYDKYSRKVTVKQGTYLSKILFLCFDEYLAEKLGFNHNSYDKRVTSKMKEYNAIEYKSGRWSSSDVVKIPPTEYEKTYNAERPIELNAGCQSLFVYSNIVKPTIVGDIFTPILRLVEVPTNAKFGDQIVIPYASPHYKPIAVNEFDMVEIGIKDDTNERIPFEFGRVIIKLHFRKKVYKKPNLSINKVL